MSGAPIISGMNQLPNPPISAGITAKKIISSPCAVTIVFHTCPVVTMSLCGTISWVRMISDSTVAVNAPTPAKIRYSVPISLWFVLHSQRVKKPGLWS